MEFQYAVWGIVLSASLFRRSDAQYIYENAELVAGIDTAVTGEFCGVPILPPDRIETLDKNVIIIVAAPSAHKPAKELLMPMGRPFILLKGTSIECYNM